MSTCAEGTYEIKNWEELPYDEANPKLVRSTVQAQYDGDIVGEAVTKYLMTSFSDGSSRFMGQARLIGHIGDREGTFVLHEHGTYIGGNTAQGTLIVLKGSGTDSLEGLHGEGAYVATHGEESVEFAGRSWEPTSERTARYLLELGFD